MIIVNLKAVNAGKYHDAEKCMNGRDCDTGLLKQIELYDMES